MTGERSNNLYFVSKGQVKVYAKDISQEPSPLYHLTTLRPGSCFNYASAILDRPSILNFYSHDTTEKVSIDDLYGLVP